MKKIYIAFLITIFISSCMVGPKYTRPPVTVNAAWSEGDTAVKTALVDPGSVPVKDSITFLKWTDVFRDTVLTSLIQKTLINNTDLLMALARVEQARALYGISRSELFPSFGYKASAGSSHVEKNARSAGAGLDGETFGAFATMNWELDLFGKLRHQKRADWAGFLAAENNAHAVQVSLIAEVATYYFLLRDADNRLEIAQQTAAMRKESLGIITERFNKGYVSELDKLQAQQQLSIAEAEVAGTELQIINIQNVLRVLTAQTPGPINRGMNIYEQQLTGEIPAGIPSDLLRRRPDILAAEQALMAQTEKIGVAMALRYPSISLTGVLGLASPDLGTLIDPASQVMGITGNILGPVFQFGRNKRRVEAQKQLTEQYSLQYRKLVLVAFAEVDNSLASLRLSAKEHEAYQKALEAASLAYKLTEARYYDGYTHYLELLNQQDNLFRVALAESSTQTAQNLAVVNLFKALGGGW